MRQQFNFWVIGGDPRQAALAEALAEDGHTVHTYALEQGADPSLDAGSLDLAGLADCVILPLPVTDGEALNAPLSVRRPSLEEVLDALRPGQLVCAGRVSPELAEEARRRGLRMTDYFAREELAVANAVPAALAVGPRKKRRHKMTVRGDHVPDGLYHGPLPVRPSLPTAGCQSVSGTI